MIALICFAAGLLLGGCVMTIYHQHKRMEQHEKELEKAKEKWFLEKL